MTLITYKPTTPLVSNIDSWIDSFFNLNSLGENNYQLRINYTYMISSENNNSMDWFELSEIIEINPYIDDDIQSNNEDEDTLDLDENPIRL